MTKIKITIPKSGEKWQISKGFGGNTKKFVSATTLTSFLERFLVRQLDTKTSVLVRYGDDYSNETELSSDKNYLIWATSCFLEDYLPKVALKRVSKLYGPK